MNRNIKFIFALSNYVTQTIQNLEENLALWDVLNYNGTNYFDLYSFETTSRLVYVLQVTSHPFK